MGTTAPKTRQPDAASSQTMLAETLDGISIPPCPSALIQALAETRHGEPNIKTLIKLISSDVSMSSLVRKWGEAASRPLSVAQVATGLGARNLIRLIILSSMRSCLSAGTYLQMEPFWAKTLKMAQMSELIAQRLHGVATDAAFVYALLHNAGIPLMIKGFPGYAENIPNLTRRGYSLIKAENSAYGCDHAVVGSLLAHNWQLPRALAVAILYHHNIDVYALPTQVFPSPALTLVAIAHVADYLEGSSLGEADDNDQRLYRKAVEFLGLDEVEMDAIREELHAAHFFQGV